MSLTKIELVVPRRSNVYDDVRALVISSALTPNTRIRVEEIAKRVDAGTTPVREALFQLSAEGLVTVNHQKGFWQPDIDRVELRHLIETKTALEQLLLKDSPQHWNDHHEQDLVVLFHRFKKLDTLSPLGSYESNRSWLEAHRQLHLVLLAGSTNSPALHMVDMLNTNIDRYRCYIMGSWLETTGSEDLVDEVHSMNTVDAHQELYELAMARDFTALGASLAKHNAEAHALLSKALERLLRG